MKQLTFFGNWYDEYIGLKIYTNFSKERLVIQDAETKSRQLFSNKEHFINWFNAF